jgi:hypothetical protein
VIDYAADNVLSHLCDGKSRWLDRVRIGAKEQGRQERVVYLTIRTLSPIDFVFVSSRTVAGLSLG